MSRFAKLVRFFFTKSPTLDPILPDVLWQEIFGYLTYEELKSVTLVSKYWNALVSNSPRFVRHTRLSMNVTDVSSSRKCTEILKISGRKYNCVQISNLVDFDFFSTLPWYGSLTQLELSNCTIVGPELLDLLRQSTTIKSLMFRAVKIAEQDEIVFPLKLKLINLAVQHENKSTDWILDHLNCSEVSNFLEIRGFRATAWRKSDSVVRFLDRLEGQVNLLLIDGINLDATAVAISTNFNFKWHFMCIKPFENVQMNRLQSPITKQLCETSADGATLKVSWTYDYSTRREKVRNALQILKLCDCRHIKTLIFGWHELRDVRVEDFAEIGTLDSFETLKFRCYESHCGDPHKIEEALFSMLPNVRNLTIEFSNVDCFNDLKVDSISSKLRNMENLRIEWKSIPRGKDLVCIKLKNIHFPEMKSISLSPVEMMMCDENSEEVAEQLTKMTQKNHKLRMITFIDEFCSMSHARSDEFLESMTELLDGCSFVHTLTVARVEYSRYSPLSSSDVPFQERVKTFALKNLNCENCKSHQSNSSIL